MNRPQRSRRTTTPLKGRKSSGKRPLFLVALALIAALVSFRVATQSKGADNSPCLKDACVTIQPSLSESKAVDSALPCPYCNQDASAWARQTSAAPPKLSGTSAAVIEGACGRLVYGLRQDDRVPPASIAKIVTAIVAAREGRLTDQVPINVNGWDLALQDGSSVAGLEAGTKLTLEELLYALMLPSGNDAALAIADYFGGAGRFTDLMNQTVKRLGLSNSRFLNPDGRDKDGNYTSAMDMGLLGRELMTNPALRKIAGTKTTPASWDGHTLWNTNYLVYGYPGATGVKFGYTEGARETIVGAAARNGRELYVSVLSSDFAYLDAVKLLDWAFANTHPDC
jgi:D-alanyl-D-alanine carboxypeptidase (penicillin-binding protein 5/6)